jgi:polar amino acid transport system substrate-binding protein
MLACIFCLQLSLAGTLRYEQGDFAKRFCLRTLTLLLLLVTLVVPLTARADDVNIPRVWDQRQRLAKPDTNNIRRLRFLTTTDFFPFNFLDQEGRLTGFHVDLARALCEVLDMENRCQIQALPWDELRPALADGEGEAILAGVAITAQSRTELLFSRPYLSFPARFVGRSGEPFEPGGRAEGRVGVIAGSAHERMLRSWFPRMQPVTYSRDSWLMGDLQKGVLDAVFGDGMRLSFWLADQPDDACCAFVGESYFAPEFLGHGLAIALPPDAHELKAALDHALQTIEANGRFEELYLRYFPVGFY